MKSTFDITIIGAGIVGLATGLRILEHNPSLKILILEKEDNIAKHQTGNNSGVIHSGIYYKPGSLKAKNCRKGYKMLLDFCSEHKINYEICGKLIVAKNPGEEASLNEIYGRGKENGLEGLELIGQEEIKNFETNATGYKAIYVPQTGIIDFKNVASKYAQLIEKYGGEIKFGQEVKAINISGSSVEVSTVNDKFSSAKLISCAGLFSDRIAKMTNPAVEIRIIPFRGEYYKLKPSRGNLIKGLIYPVPDIRFPFLGVHFTKQIDGGIEVGPNAVLSFKREGYSKLSFNFMDFIETITWPGFYKVVRKYWRMGIGEFYRSFNKKAFVKELQKLVPVIDEEDLEKGGAGVRAQACSKTGGLIDDFYIIENQNVIHVLNAPSPAATASLAIGDFLAKKILSAKA